MMPDQDMPKPFEPVFQGEFSEEDRLKILSDYNTCYQNVFRNETEDYPDEVDKKAYASIEAGYRIAEKYVFTSDAKNNILTFIR